MGKARSPELINKPNSARLALIDDNVDSAVSMAMMLEALGHEAVVSHDGPTALETAESFRPALVLLDIGLPGMNGFMVAERLRAGATLNGVVLAGLTGYGDEQDRRRSKEAGFDHHFVKPIGLSALQELIKTLPGAAS